MTLKVFIVSLMNIFQIPDSCYRAHKETKFAIIVAMNGDHVSFLFQRILENGFFVTEKAKYFGRFLVQENPHFLILVTRFPKRK